MRSACNWNQMDKKTFLRIWMKFTGTNGDTELFAEVVVTGFRGTGSAWFSMGQILDFAEKLEAFPLCESKHPALRGGFYDKARRGEFEQVHLSIRVYPVGSRGQVGVRVHVATPVWDDERDESQKSATVELLTTYNQLASFGRQIRGLARGELSEAVLAGEMLEW